MKIAINTAWGGWELSEKACIELGLQWNGCGFHYCEDGDRTRPELIACIEKLGKSASAPYSKIKIVEIPDDIDWYIHEYDGWETVEESHRSWS